MYKYILISLYLILLLTHLFIESPALESIYEYFYQYKLLLPTYSSEYDFGKFEGSIIITICILAYSKNWKIIGVIFNSLLLLQVYLFLNLLSNLVEITSSPADTQAYVEAKHIRNLIEDAAPEINAQLLIIIITALTYLIPVMYKMYKNSLLGLWIEKQKTSLRNDLKK